MKIWHVRLLLVLSLHLHGWEQVLSGVGIDSTLDELDMAWVEPLSGFCGLSNYWWLTTDQAWFSWWRQLHQMRSGAWGKLCEKRKRQFWSQALTEHRLELCWRWSDCLSFYKDRRWPARASLGTGRSRRQTWPLAASRGRLCSSQSLLCSAFIEWFRPKLLSFLRFLIACAKCLFEN